MILLVFCCTILFTTQDFTKTVEAATEQELQAEIGSLNSTYDALKQQQNAVQSQINSAKNEKEKQLAIKNQLDTSKSNTQQQVDVLEQKIRVSQELIETNERNIASMEENVAESYELFLKRVRALYMSGDTSELELILGAKDYSEALMKAKVMQSIAEHDKELIESLVKTKENIEEALADVEENKKEQDANKAELEIKKNELEVEIAKKSKEIQDISQLESQFLANKAQIEQDMKAAQAEISAIYSQIESMGEFVGGEFGWPVPGYSMISSQFGPRFGGSDYHTGIDITGSGVNGAAIKASNSGTVAHVENNFIQGRGYGKYVIVDHGGGYSTLYAHCSSIQVAVGQKVERGATIANVGNTGWSTGPHLHFEVRVNGQAKNPSGYLKG